MPQRRSRCMRRRSNGARALGFSAAALALALVACTDGALLCVSGRRARVQTERLPVLGAGALQTSEPNHHLAGHACLRCMCTACHHATIRHAKLPGILATCSQPVVSLFATLQARAPGHLPPGS